MKRADKDALEHAMSGLRICQEAQDSALRDNQWIRAYTLLGHMRTHTETIKKLMGKV